MSTYVSVLEALQNVYSTVCRVPMRACVDQNSVRKAWVKVEASMYSYPARVYGTSLGDEEKPEGSIQMASTIGVSPPFLA